MTMMAPEQDRPPQPDPQFIIQAMNEELQRTNDNRLYLMAMLNQKDAQIQAMAAQMSQIGGELERMRTEQAERERVANLPQVIEHQPAENAQAE